MNDWIITSLGKIVRRDKAKPTDCIPLNVLDSISVKVDDLENIPNSFLTKEEARLCRDNIIEHCPAAFLEGNLPKSITQPKNTVSSNPEKYSQEEFNRITRQKLIENYDVFWANFQKLKPRDACDVYMKMARYGFSVAPAVKPLDEEAEQRKQAIKQQQTADTIAEGLPDIDFDCDDDTNIDAVNTTDTDNSCDNTQNNMEDNTKNSNNPPAAPNQSDDFSYGYLRVMSKNEEEYLQHKAEWDSIRRQRGTHQHEVEWDSISDEELFEEELIADIQDGIDKNFILTHRDRTQPFQNSLLSHQDKNVEQRPIPEHPDAEQHAAANDNPQPPM